VGLRARRLLARGDAAQVPGERPFLRGFRRQPVHPVYLDISMMTSFLAYLNGGVVTSEEQTQKEAAARESSWKGHAGARIRLPFALDAEAGSEGGAHRNEEISLELKSARHHTPASLFTVLYDYLSENALLADLKDACQLGELETGQLVQLSGEYLGNPLEDALAHVSEVSSHLAASHGLASGLQWKSGAEGAPRPGRHALRQEGAELFETEAAVSRKSECADNDSAIQVILRMAELLQGAPVHDLLICSPAGFHAVLTASSAYYSQETRELLRAGEFRIVGKVSRIVTGESTINLTRRMSLAAAQPVVTRELLAAARAAGLPIGFADSVVRAPAVQIIPMAVFL
jgi:hypothetical protein